MSTSDNIDVPWYAVLKLLPLCLALGMTALGMTIGCSEQSDLAPLTGSVTYNGTPLEFGGVTMQPAGGGAISRGIIQSDGTFAMTTDGREGAPIGVNSVRVTCFTSQKPGAESADAGGEATVGRSLIPENYSRFSSSGLSIEVKPDENQPYNIELADQ